MLGFETEGCPVIILSPTFQFLFTFHEVTTIELDARLRGVDVHNDSGFITLDPGCENGGSL